MVGGYGRGKSEMRDEGGYGERGEAGVWVGVGE